MVLGTGYIWSLALVLRQFGYMMDRIKFDE